MQMESPVASPKIRYISKYFIKIIYCATLNFHGVLILVWQIPDDLSFQLLYQFLLLLFLSCYLR